MKGVSNKVQTLRYYTKPELWRGLLIKFSVYLILFSMSEMFSKYIAMNKCSASILQCTNVQQVYCNIQMPV
jgi:hypothetical protein